MAVGRTVGLVVLVMAVAAASGCGGRIGAAGPGEYAGDISSRDVAGGYETYRLICAACHAGRVNPDGYGWEPWRMRLQIREGNHLMPPVRGHTVSDAELEAVIAYLSTTGAVVGEIPLPEDASPSQGGDLPESSAARR